MKSTLLTVTITLSLTQVGAAQVAPATRATGLLFTPDDQYRSIPLAATPLMGGGLPRSTDLGSFFPVPGDQGRQASCVGWAVAGLKAYQEARERSWMPDTADRQFSAAFIYNQIARQGCTGGSYILDALNLVRRDGAATLRDFPYNPMDCARLPTSNERQSAREFAIADWRRVNVQDDIEVKSHIAAGFPILIGMMVDQGFMRLAAGEVYQEPTSPPVGGHAILVVGYDDGREAFKLFNSWGAGWADRGSGWISYEVFRRVVREGFVAQDIVLSPPIQISTRGTFDYFYSPGNVVLHWRKVDLETWVEDASPGSPHQPITFKVTGTTAVDGTNGTVVRAQDRPMDVFIPNLGASGARPSLLLQRHGGTNWQWAPLGEIR